MKKILVITPVHHIAGVTDILEKHFEVTYLDDPSYEDVIKIISNYHAIYTNPNKSKVYIDIKLMNAGKNLTVICTASTGTNHIDIVQAKKQNITVLSIGKDFEIIEKISSTAEMALALTMASIRNMILAAESVRIGQWDYQPYIGRQINCLTVGVIGYGRLGKKYANYLSSMGAKVLVYDPYVDKIEKHTKVNKLDDLLEKSNIISLHVHVNDETSSLIDKKSLLLMKEDAILINTSRGEIVNESDLLENIKKNKKFKYATDVLSNEVKSKKSVILEEYKNNNYQILITPHIGGMTSEAQEMAFGHAAQKLVNHFNKA